MKIDTMRPFDLGDAVYVATAVEHLHAISEEAPMRSLDLELATGLAVA
jgi:hypothetical protein